MLTFASSQNDVVDSRRAMRDALEDALSRLPPGNDKLIVFHTTMGHDFRELVDEAARICPGAQMAGCTGSGVISLNGASERMRTLAVMVVDGPGELAVASAESIRGEDSFEVSRKAAAELASRCPGIRMVQLMASGIDIAADRAIAGIEAALGPDVQVFGGTSGDNMRCRTCFAFHGTRILERGLVLAGYADPTLRLVARAHHGSVPIGKPFVVTRSEANRVDELDGQPAWPHLTAKLGVPVETDVAETLVMASLGQELPEDLQAEYGSPVAIHTLFKVDDERRSFFTPASVPAGTRLWLMQRDEDRMFSGVDWMMGKLMEDLAGKRPVAVFHSDCAARGRFMFSKILKDEIIARLQQPLLEAGELPWLGLYGFGELTPLGGRNWFHTQTSSLHAMVRDPGS